MARRVLTAALLLLSAAPAPAQLASKRRELSKIQDELKDTLGELERLRAEERTLGRDIEGLRSRDDGAKKRLSDLQSGIRRAEARRSELRSRLDAARSVTGFWTAALASEAARHRAAGAAGADAWGTRGLWAEEYRRAAMLEKGRHLRGLHGFSRSTERAAEETRRRAGDLEAGRRRAEAERQAARAEYEEKKAALEQAQKKAAAAAARAKELEESARAMTALINKLSRPARGRKTAAPPARLEIPRHSLPWPAAGRVVGAYGREKDPELGTWTVRQGVVVSVPPAVPIGAVADGRVIFAGPFRSYGKVVIVEHGGSFFSVYGELGETSAVKGDRVRAGQPLARASEAGSAGRYYLELRRGTEALDPEDWLRKK